MGNTLGYNLAKMGGCCCIDTGHSAVSELEATTEFPLKVGEGKKPAEEVGKDRSPTSASSFVTKNPRRLFKKQLAVGVRQSHDSVEIPTSLVIDQRQSPSDRQLITSALQKHFIFTNLTEEQQDLVIESMKLYSVPSGLVIFEEGQPAVNFYVLASGKMEVSIKGQVVNMIIPGYGFGELALLYDTPRTATVTAKADSMLWGVDRKTFKNFVEKINSQQYEENARFLDSIRVFEVLTPRQKDSLLHLMKSTKFSPGTRIVSQGEAGDVCFIIKEGVVSCLRDGKEVRKLGKGEFFGEQALLYSGVRTATVIATNTVKCVSIGREDLQHALGGNLLQVIYRNSLRIAFDRNESLMKLSKEQWERIISRISITSHAKGQVVVPNGTRKDAALWVVLKGELAQRGSDETFAQTFSIIGDVSFSNSEKYPNDLIVKSETVDAARIGKLEFEESLGGSLAAATVHNQAFDVLTGVQLLRGLSQERLHNLINALKLRDFADKEVIVKQDDPGDSFFIIQSGKVDVIKNGMTIRQIAKLDYFGERSILSNELRSATIVAIGRVTCWVLGQADFHRLIDQSIRKQLTKRITLQDDSINLQDLFVVKTLGRGMFGVVLLTVRPDTRDLYALKSVSRAKVMQYHLKQNMLLERNILMQLDHLFIMKLIKTFKDETHMHFLAEYVRGMDFFDVLRKMDALLSSQEARFYVACLMIILEHLHERDIIYRDLKPENIMIDEDGYPKLIDFGTAKIVQSRTYTIIGTPHYMAPEVVVGKGYNATADYWSVGVILYELMCARVPFGDDEDDPYKIYERIIEERLSIPSSIRGPVRTVIEMLLNKNPSMRLGGTMENFKKHAWFSGMNWVRDR